MTTPVKVANKIDDFAIEISIADISSLTKGLLQLQHARYPHLVPMYRTVHRTKPREMVLRAIRWVNPKRMFPGAGKTRAEMEGMSSDELEKLIVDLNDYRGEAHVIHNRYNHMIELINMGELPYFIPYAGFKQDKWNMLQEYMDRAVRLKEGTEAWENVLDHQALEIRNILLKRDGGDRRKLDDIDGLWVDAKGNAAAPNFMDIKKGKDKKIALRVNRISADGKRVRHKQKVYVRRFAAVHPQEARRGEVIRMPAGGQVRRPGRNNPTARKIFDEHGGAAAHLVRMPKGWAMGTDSPELREKGNMISMPAGRKDPMILTFSELDFDDVANRREARWTQPDPLGKRGVARHRGGASAAPGGHRAEGMESDEVMRRALRNVRQRQQSVEERRRRNQERRGGGPRQRQERAETPIEPNAAAIQINSEFLKATSDLYQQYDVDTTNIKEMQAYTGDNIQSAKIISGGVNAGDGFVIGLTMKNGKKYIYKVVTNEQKSEQVADAIDKILGLNVNVDTTIFNNFSIDDLRRAGLTPRSADKLQKQLNNGGGHLQAFCEPNCREAIDFNGSRDYANYKNPVFRGDLHRMHINDWITGNWDRHRKNYMVTDEGRAVQIDTGFGLGVASVHNRDNNPVDDRGDMFATKGGQQGYRGVAFRTPHARDGGIMFDPSNSSPQFDRIDASQEDIQKELEAVFDEFVTMDKLQDIQQAFGMRNKLENLSIQELKEDFIQKAGVYWATKFTAPIDNYGETAVRNNMDADEQKALFGRGGGGGAAGPDTQADRDAAAQEQQEFDDRRQRSDELLAREGGAGRQRGRGLNTADRESLDRIAEQAERDASEDRRAVQDAENREVAQEAGDSERRGAERRRQARTSTPPGVRADEPRGVSGFTDSPGMRGADESSRRGMTDEDFDISEDDDREINTSEIDRALASDEERDDERPRLRGTPAGGSRDT